MNSTRVLLRKKRKKENSEILLLIHNIYWVWIVNNSLSWIWIVNNSLYWVWIANNSLPWICASNVWRIIKLAHLKKTLDLKQCCTPQWPIFKTVKLWSLFEPKQGENLNFTWTKPSMMFEVYLKSAKSQLAEVSNNFRIWLLELFSCKFCEKT